MKLKEIAHSRTGDKGEISNISLIPYNEQDYDFLKGQVTAQKVKDYFSDICKGEVIRYELPAICAFNFVLDQTLGGGVTRSLAMDKHGKSLGMALLEMEIDDLPSITPISEACAHRDLRADTPSAETCDRPTLTGKTIRIGSGAGYAGDRLDAALELMEKGSLDYIIFECLAERTIAIGQRQKQEDPDLGYNALLKQRMEKVLPLAKKHGIKVITNMGAANPAAAARMTLDIANRLQLVDLNIAYVTGDDIFDQIHQYEENVILENGCRLKDFHGHIISANAYMGADSIVEALDNGADIIITGRVSDPALTVGPLVHEFGWNVVDHADQMGQAILAGHLLECAGQVTGGYYADPGFKDVPDLDRLGFPIVEIAKDGALTVSKVTGSGGTVTVDTCKEQMIYEIHDPKAYMTPDAIADFSNVRFVQADHDLVYAYGATSHLKPDTLKVSMGYLDCYIAEAEISYGGQNCENRCRLAADIISKRLKNYGEMPDEFRIDYIGLNSLYQDKISAFLTSGTPHELRVRFAARYTDPAAARNFANDVETLYTNGPAGGGGVTKSVNQVLSICSIFVPRENVSSKIHYLSQLIPFPLKGVLQHFPLFGNVIRKHIPVLSDASRVLALPEDITVEGLKKYFNLSELTYSALCSDICQTRQQFEAQQAREIAEFGVDVDVNAPCHLWSNTDADIQKKCVDAIAAKYRGRKHEIVFYGPSNIQMWYSLEQDMLPYAAQNHGMGGCVDSEMITYAPQMLYDFEPSIVFFQTGSNDLALGLSLEEIMENKKRMYSLFLEHMPHSKLVVMSGLPLPGRQMFWEGTKKVNAMLKDMCAQMDRMYFMDATDFLTTENGTGFMPQYYRADGIHLNKAGHDIWTACMKNILHELLS